MQMVTQNYHHSIALVADAVLLRCLRKHLAYSWIKESALKPALLSDK